jgi:hypothetical protein
LAIKPATARTLNAPHRDVLEHFGDGGAHTRMDVRQLGWYLVNMVGRAVWRGSVGLSSKSWCGPVPSRDRRAVGPF